MRHWISIFLSFALAGCATLDIKNSTVAREICRCVRTANSRPRSQRKKSPQVLQPPSLIRRKNLPWTDERRLTLLLESARAILAAGNFSDGAEQLYNRVVRQIVAMLGAGGIKDRAIRGAGG